LILRLVHLVCQKVHLPVVASTGIESGVDAAKYLIAGAKAVAVGTAGLHNPKIVAEVYWGLKKLAASYGMSDVKELSGSLIL
jgi:dihydroorotate dehydrogenase (NAD+) catalytic subunit